MNALSLYVTTCRMVFQSCADDSGAWADIYRLLSYLRQALTCCVCGNLLMIPTTSAVSPCQHNVCKCCIGGKMRLRPSCSWCKDYNKFSENVQLRIILQCYKKLCEYMISSALHRKWGSLNGGTTINFADIVQEGAEFRDEFCYSQVSQRNTNSLGLLNVSRSLPGIPLDGARSSSPEFATDPAIINGEPVKNGNGSVYSVMVAGSNSTKIMIKRTTTEGGGNDTHLPTVPESVSKRLRASEANNSTVMRNQRMKQKKRGCRCGMATPNPGKLTCCGQRCPCYVDGKACVDCRCRGCRNPNKLLTKDGHNPDQQFSKSETEIVHKITHSKETCDATSDDLDD